MSKSFYWTLLIVAMTIQFVGALFYFNFFADAEFVRVIYGLTKLIMFALPIVVWKKQLMTLPSLIKGNHAKSILLGFASGLLIAITIYVASSFLHANLSAFALAIAEKADRFDITKIYIPFAIAFCLINPIFEEYYWRWFVVSGLQVRLGWLASAVLGNIAFASHHFIVVSQFFPVSYALPFAIAIALGGMIWSWQYKQSQSLAGSMISHALVDAAIFFVGYQLLFS